MSEKKSVLPKVEILIIGVFFMAFAAWAISRCSATSNAYEEEARLLDAEQAKADSIAAAEAGLIPEYQPKDTLLAREAESPTAPPGEAYTPLYVVTPALNLRTGPGLKYKVLERLALHDEVAFLNEVTDTTQLIDLGDIIAEEPWVKVRSANGKEGWVFGACVDYYKHTLEGVEVD
ncbi:SH3 domain-containing protein [Phaeodactylibacter luteus]|uniref:SH3 domain-containing protein n=1 Tax=Phaeodactylibacter luteus TaxID=1564516 RepID=A0A5C6RI69_9BACT|nr:SH3 domain-containing protein [Phaeodactylibacter luteus]TXB61605.1 SH3 domain-containing protein [Phaeodactylibacter luteus]